MKEEIEAELKDLYDGTWACLRELSILFKIDICQLAYFFDYKGCKKRHDKAVRKWQKKNPEKIYIDRIMNRILDNHRWTLFSKIRFFGKTFRVKKRDKKKSKQLL